MKSAVDCLLQKYHGEKDMLQRVDHDYADMVHRSASDPNSLLHPTTRLHISRYVKHLAKLINTKSSLNTSPEKLLLTQQLWHSLTEGSETVSVPVVTMGPAIYNPPLPASALSTPLSQELIDKIVEGIMKHQQHQHQHQQHQDFQQLQQLSSSSQLPAAQSAIAANPFLAMHSDAAATTGTQKNTVSV